MLLQVHDSWFGFAESRLRRLVEVLGEERLLSDIYLYPREFRHAAPVPPPVVIAPLVTATTTEPATAEAVASK